MKVSFHTLFFWTVWACDFCSNAAFFVVVVVVAVIYRLLCMSTHDWNSFHSLRSKCTIFRLYERVCRMKSNIPQCSSCCRSILFLSINVCVLHKAIFSLSFMCVVFFLNSDTKKSSILFFATLGNENFMCVYVFFWGGCLEFTYTFEFMETFFRSGYWSLLNRLKCM